MVVPSAPLRPVRPRRLLRLLAIAARQRARGRDRPPADPELRAGRRLVLELCGEPDVRLGPGTGPARSSPPRSAGARPGRPGPPGLAAPPALGFVCSLAGATGRSP